MKISFKLILGYCFIASLVFVVSFVSISLARNTQEKYTEVVDLSFQVVDQLDDLNYLGLRIIMSTNELGLIFAEQRAFGGEFKELYEEEHKELDEEVLAPFDQALEKYEQFLAQHFPEEIYHAVEIREAGEQIKQISLKLISQQESGISGQEILQIKDDLEEAEEVFLEAVEKALEHEVEELDENKEELASIIANGIADIKISSLLTFAFALLLGIIISRHLTKPIRVLAEATQAVAKGRLETRVDVDSKDEIGQLANAFNTMSETLGQTTVSKDFVVNILSSMAEALFVLDSQGKITRINKAVATLLGYEDDELIGHPFNELFISEALQQNTCLGLTGRDEVCECETTCTSRAGQQIPVHLSSSLLYDADGEMLGAVYLAKDIRERLRAEQALLDKTQHLERSNGELDQFAYVVSHDLKAPLRAIANLATWIEEDMEGKVDEDTKTNLDLMHSRVQRMENLINGVLEYSRIGRSEEKTHDVDVQKLLVDVVDSMPTPEGFTVHVNDNMPVVLASPVRLSQVFSNLISNAIKYRRDEGGRVDVIVDDAGDYYRFSVADNGPGISPDYHDKVFVIFQTLNARDKVESTGVGLTLVKKIVEEQGGEVTLKSEEGNGATFSFTWPKQLMEKEKKSA